MTLPYKCLHGERVECEVLPPEIEGNPHRKLQEENLHFSRDSCT